MKRKKNFVILLWTCIILNIPVYTQENKTFRVPYQGAAYTLYPEEYEKLPDIPSPCKMKNGIEILVALTLNSKYTLIPVTIENGSPWIPDQDLWGKDNQLEINAEDFPTLARTGLHSETELDSIKTITGRPIDEINRLGLPGGLSDAGFFSGDENILSVLKGDNRIAKALGLTHPQLAEPLFHVWNLIGKAGHERIKSFRYNNKTIFLKASRTKPGQLSLFNDGFRGGSNIYIFRPLHPGERSFLKQNYPDLNEEQMIDFVKKLTNIHTGELEAYYVKRHGFYEGHTEYRVDPIAITWVFGLKSLEEIEQALKGELYKTLVNHFTQLESQPESASGHRE